MIQNIIIKDDIEHILNSGINWEEFKNKKILITGANGFLPAYLVYALLSANDKYQLNLKLAALVRNGEKANKRFENFKTNSSLVYIVQDVSEPIPFDSYNFIIHAASQASPKFYSIDPVGTLKPNTIGTNNLLELAVKAKTEAFLYFSSSEVYGQVDDNNNPISENQFGYLDPMRVRSCYAESKRMGETMCSSFFHQFSVPVKIVRPFHTYGPGMDLNDGRVYADFVKNIISGNDIIMTSDGMAKRAFCYITDATVAFLKVLIAGAPGEAYNVGNEGQEYSIRELADILIKLVPEKKLEAKFFTTPSGNYLSSQVLRNCPDCTKISKLNWKPQTSVQEGFKRTIESYK